MDKEQSRTRRNKLKVFSGILQIGPTIGVLSICIWIEILSLGTILSAFGFIHYKWVILLLVAPIIVATTCIGMVALVLLVGSIKGYIPSDMASYTKKEEELRGN